MATRQRQTRMTIWDGQKAISLDQFPPQAWTDLSLSAAGSNDSRADREAMQNFYETVAVLFRCIELRQVGISRVPWAIVRNGKDIWLDSEPEPPSQLSYLKDFRRLLQLTEAALCLSPEAFWFVEHNRARPLALRWHAPSSVIPQWSATKGLTGFKRLLGQGESRIFEPEDYIYFALPNPFHETIPGRPPAQTALGSAGVLYFVDAFVGKFIERGAIKATLFTAPRGTATTERDRLLAWLKRNLTGIKQAFSTEVITDDVKPITVGEGLENLSQSELTIERKQDIATALGIPHSLLFSNAANFATAQQDDIHLYDKTIIPAFSRLADIANRQLLEPQGYSLELRPDSMSIFQADEHERSTSVQSLVNAGMELDLAMEILGYDLTDEQWARVKAPKSEPPPPAMIAPPVPAPENAVEQPIIDTADKTAEIALLRRWASKRKHPAPADFQSQLLTDAEKAIIIAEVSSGKDFFEVAATPGPDTHKAKPKPFTPIAELRKRMAAAELKKRAAAERKAEEEIAAALEKQSKRVFTSMPGPGRLDDFAEWAREDLENALRYGPSQEELDYILKQALLESSSLGVDFAIADLESVGFGMDWTLANEKARDWARDYAGQLIKDIDATTIDAVRQHVATWTETGTPLETLVENLMPTFGRGRAQRIATTEITRSYAEGNRVALKESGVVTRWEWQTSNDELVCPICRPLHGKIVKIDAPFNAHLPASVKVDTFSAPPGHVNCRCWTLPVVDDVPVEEIAEQAFTMRPASDYSAERLEEVWNEIGDWEAERKSIARQALNDFNYRGSPYNGMIFEKANRIEGIASYRFLDEQIALINNFATRSRGGQEMLAKLQESINVKFLEFHATVSARTFYERIGAELVPGTTNIYRWNGRKL